MPSTASAARSPARPTLDPEGVVDRRAMRFHGGGTAWNHVAMDQAIRGCRAGARRHLERAHRHHHGLGRPLDPGDRRIRRHRPREGTEAHRPVRRAEGDVLDRLRDAGDLVQDPRRELLDLLGLRDVEPLHRQRRRDHPGRPAGHHLRRRLRGSRLDAVGAVRRHGRHVVEVQRHAVAGLARLRREPRRLRHRGRRGRAGARGAGARQGARRPDLRRDRRLRRHLGRVTTWSRPPARAPCAACARRWTG